MKKFGKVIWVLFIILFFCGYTPPLSGTLCRTALCNLSLQLNVYAEDSPSLGSQWQEVPAYGTELQAIAEWQGTSADDTTETKAEETSNNNGTSTGALGGLIDGELTTAKLDSAAKEAATTLSNMDNQDKADMMGAQLNRALTSFGAMGKLVLGGNPSATELSGGLLGDYSLKSIQEAFIVQCYGALGVNGYFFADKLGLISLDEENTESNEASASPENSSGSLAGGSGNLLGGLSGGNSSNLFSTATIPNNTTATINSSSNTKTTPKVRTTISKTTSTATKTSGTSNISASLGGVGPSAMFGNMLNNATPMQRAYVTTMSTDAPILPFSIPVTADFDPSKPGEETKWLFSPIVIDADKNGVLALDSGTIPFDIAPHIAGLETIPVPAPGKDMFLVWDKAGTETIEGTAREYKEGEIVDITELFGPTDYTRSDFSVLAYTDDGFTKLRKLCDIDNDGDVDKQDTALSAEVAAKLKLWSPLSGELVLFKDTDIVIDVRAGSYERHPSDVEGWAVEYKMKDNQDRLVGYQWLTSKTGSLLCVDVLLAIQ